MPVFTLDHDLYSGVYTLYYFGKEVGYISKIQYQATGERGYRGVSVHGDIVYGRSLKAAQALLMGVYH